MSCFATAVAVAEYRSVHRQHREKAAGRGIRGRARALAMTVAGAAGRDLNQGVEHPGVAAIEHLST